MNNQFKLFFLLVCAFFASFTLYAQVGQEKQPAGAGDSRLVVNLGVGYRNFSSTRFKTTTLPAFKGVFPQSGVAGNVVEYNSGIGKVGVDSAGNKFRDVAVVVHKAGGSFAGSDSHSFTEDLAPAIGVDYSFWQKDKLTMAVSGGLQYYNLDAKSKAGNKINAEYSTLQTVLPGVPPAPERDRENSNYLSATGKSKFEMDLYAVDLGLKVDYAATESLVVFAAIGPTLALADMDSSSVVSLTRKLDGQKLAGGRSSDSSRDWVFGAYASCGIGFWFNGRVGASLELRYDEAFKNASTRNAKQDLDSFGGLLKVMARF